MKKKIQWKDVFGFLQKKQKKKKNGKSLKNIIEALESVAKKETIRKKVQEIMFHQKSEKSQKTLTLKPDKHKRHKRVKSDLILVQNSKLKDKFIQKMIRGRDSQKEKIQKNKKEEKVNQTQDS